MFNFTNNEKKLSAAEKRLILANRLAKTSDVLLDMVDCLRKHGAKPELLDYAETHIVKGLLAADCSLDWIKQTSNPDKEK